MGLALSAPFRQFAPGFFSQARLAEDGSSAWARKALLACSLIGNLGMLGFFKYYNFFVDSFVQMLHSLA